MTPRVLQGPGRYDLTFLQLTLGHIGDTIGTSPSGPSVWIGYISSYCKVRPHAAVRSEDSEFAKGLAAETPARRRGP